MNILSKIIETGLIKELSGNELKIYLLVLDVTHEDEALVIDDVSISKMLTIGLPTTRKALNRLCDIQIDGKHIMYKVSSNDYSINQIAVRKENDYKLTAVLGLYREKYHEVYGVEPNIVFPVELSKLKNLAIREKYTWEQIKIIVEIGVGEYKDRWANSNFPRPNIGAVFGWLSTKCLEIHSDSIPKEFDDSCNNDTRLF